jgi:C_GCAxxG_C_C family probable redox protein
MDCFEKKKSEAIADLEKGFNCAQSVFRQFSKEHGVPETVSLKIASGFGGGLRMAKTCGAVSGAIMALGLMFGYDNVENQDDKERMNEITLQFLNDFKNKFKTTDCKDLLGIDVTIPGNRQIAYESGVIGRMCPDCIITAIDLISKVVKNSSENT